jgi:DNA-binding MarR family transcriptional regulator
MSATAHAGRDPARTPAGNGDDLVEALLSISRVVMGVAARSLAGVDAEVTLPQFRALMVIASRGPQRIADISSELGVSPSTGTRMCERLVRKGLMCRERPADDRREVHVSLTDVGVGIVADVTRLRRAELSRIVEAVPAMWHAPAVGVLQALASAAGEPTGDDWWLGWRTDADPSDPQ